MEGSTAGNFVDQRSGGAVGAGFGAVGTGGVGEIGGGAMGAGGNPRLLQVDSKGATAGTLAGRAAEGSAARWAPINGSFVLSWIPPSKARLQTNISQLELYPVLLDVIRYNEEAQLTAAKAGLEAPKASSGPACPVFEFGFERFPGIGSCWEAGIADEKRAATRPPVNCKGVDPTCIQKNDLLPHNKWSAQVGGGKGEVNGGVDPTCIQKNDLLPHNKWSAQVRGDFQANSCVNLPSSPSHTSSDLSPLQSCAIIPLCNSLSTHPPLNSTGAGATQCVLVLRNVYINVVGQVQVLVLRNVYINVVGQVQVLVLRNVYINVVGQVQVLVLRNVYINVVGQVQVLVLRNVYINVVGQVQVLVLRNVYINVVGQVFNATHLFDHNACAGSPNITVTLPFRYTANRTRVTHFKELVSLVDWFAWSTRAMLLDLIPLFISLHRILPAMRGVPVAVGHRRPHVRNGLEQLCSLGAVDVLGVQVDKMNVHVVKSKDLFFAEKLVIPLHQRCGEPSRSLWHYLRMRHLLPPGGLPIFNA
ncbi:unnamed protein product, partial [Closterium sp. Naga37s-1]